MWAHQIDKRPTDRSEETYSPTLLCILSPHLRLEQEPEKRRRPLCSELSEDDNEPPQKTLLSCLTVVRTMHGSQNHNETTMFQISRLRSEDLGPFYLASTPARSPHVRGTRLTRSPRTETFCGCSGCARCNQGGTRSLRASLNVDVVLGAGVRIMPN